MKKFDFAIGNPPYQDETIGDNEGFAPPVYNKFLESANQVADKVEMIHPARFLFNAGSTPKAWNEKMLNDIHFKVLEYESDATKMFPNTDIKGGVAISYRDTSKDFGAIGTFTAYPELNTILKKVEVALNDSLSDIVFTQTRFNLDALYKDYPNLRDVIGSKGKDKRFRNNIFDKVNVFTEYKQPDSIPVIGVVKNKRQWRYILKKYVDTTDGNLLKWKVIIPRANGSGSFGEVLAPSVIGSPDMGYTQTFIGIGAFETEDEVRAVIAYLKTKFARCMLGILKVTQDNDREAWRRVPLQDYTENSDIDWSKSIKEIDQQLYKKYNLSDDEIAFIETHVKEMK